MTYFRFSLPGDALLQWPKVRRQHTKLLLNFPKLEQREKGKSLSNLSVLMIDKRRLIGKIDR